MDPVSLFMAATAAFNTVKKLVEAGQEIEGVLGQIGAWLGKVNELQAIDNKKPSIFVRGVVAPGLRTLKSSGAYCPRACLRACTWSGACSTTGRC